MLTSNAKKPVTCIIGGAKISTKIGVLSNLIKKMENIIIVGAMANNFIKYKGYNIGKSFFEKNQEHLLKEITENCKKNNCNLVLPEDAIVAKDNKSKGQLKTLDKIDDSDLILDIGEKTINKISEIIDKSKTILWNGPAGYFEIEEFSLGSNKIAKKITENTKNKSILSIAGGGDTVAAINKFGCSNGFTYISTAGGAFLELLEGKVLPGIKALEINEWNRKYCKTNKCNLVLPEDVIVAKDNKSKGQLKTLDKIDDTDLILDIGEKTSNKISKIIDESKTILWNGPAGYFEIKEFSSGSNKIAKKITENTKKKSLISIVGGGDTVAAINKFGCSNGFTYISTAGGAFLELLEWKVLPGIKALEINEWNRNHCKTNGGQR